MEEENLRQALRLARRGRFGAPPNPMVGAVVTDRRGQVVGEGFHARAGEDHAEVRALAAAGSRAVDGTLYCSLEPCSYQGRTPPCVETVIRAGVSRVVVCHLDPNPRVAGRGVAALRESGIAVDCGRLAAQAIALNLGFVVHHQAGRPAVTLKWAMSADGRIATAGGESQWISSSQGRRWALGLREEHDAIAVGSGTLLADDPRLDRRLGRSPQPILRVVLDRRLRFPESAAMLRVAGPVVIYTESENQRRIAALSAAGAEVVHRPRITPTFVLTDLARRGVQSLLVEGGGQLTAAFAGAGLFERIEICCAPLLLGGATAPGPLGGSGVKRLADGARFEIARVGRRGPDVILSGYREGLIRELVTELGDRG